MEIRRPAKVRIATPSDIEPLYWLCYRDLHEDNPAPFTRSPQKIYDLVEGLCTGRIGIAGVIDGRHGPVASIGIEAAQPRWSEDWFLDEAWLFVQPSARKGSSYFDDLFRFALWHQSDMTQRLGYDVVLQASVLSRKRLPAKLRLWGRYGEMVGGSFWIQGESHGRQVDDHHQQERAASAGNGRLPEFD